MNTSLHRSKPFTKANGNGARFASKRTARQHWPALRSRAVAEVPVAIDASTSTPAVEEAVAPIIAAPVPAPAPVSVPSLPTPDTEAAVEVISDLRSSAGDALGGISGAAGDATTQLSQAADEATAQLTQAAGQASAQLSQAADEAAAQLNAAASSISGAAAGAQQQLSQAASGLSQGISTATSSISSTASEALGSASSTLSSAYDSASSQLSSTLEAASSSYQQVAGAVSSTTKQATSAISSTTAAVKGTIDSTVHQVAAAYASTTSQVAAAVGEATSQALEALPEPARESLLAAAGGVKAAAGQAAAHPLPVLALTGAVVVPLYVKSYMARYGGYAGELDPAVVRALLLEQESLLVDIRSDEEREADGIPQLKLAARFRAVAFPLPPQAQLTQALSPDVARRSSSPAQLALQIQAAYISGLKEVQGPLTRFVIMDTTGSDRCRELARALRNVGVAAPYVMAGGYRRWQQQELPTAASGRYDSSVALLIGDEIEQLGATAAEKLSPLKDPKVSVPLAAGSGLLALAVYNYHTTLEYIGVVSLLLTVGNKLLSYESPQALLEDVGSAAGRVAALLPSGQVAAAGAAAAAAGGADGEEEEEVVEQAAGERVESSS